MGQGPLKWVTKFRPSKIKTILNFHFDYLTPSLSKNVTDNAVDRLNMGYVYIEPECDEYIEIINYSNNFGPNIYSDIPL